MPRGRYRSHGPYRYGHHVHNARWRACVKAVRLKGGAASPEAVCTARLGAKGFLPKRPRRHRR